ITDLRLIQNRRREGVSPSDPGGLCPVRIVFRYSERGVTAAEVAFELRVLKQVHAIQLIIVADLVVHLDAELVLVNWGYRLFCGLIVDWDWKRKRVSKNPRVCAQTQAGAGCVCSAVNRRIH